MFASQEARQKRTDDTIKIIDFMPSTDRRNRNAAVCPGELLFRPNPSVIEFPHFEPFETYEMVIAFTNIDKVKYNHSNIS
jgi:hypothetical protein